MKAPLPPDEAGRLADLHDYSVLDTRPESDFDDLTLLAAQICQCPIAAITLVDEKRQWFKSVRGMAVTEISRDDSFCAHALLEPTVLLQVRDAQLDERFADNPMVVSGPHLRAYVGASLVTPQGHPLGTICVLDTVPRQFAHEQLLALQALSRQVVAQLELRRQSRQLSAQVAQLAAHTSEAVRLLELSQTARRVLLSVIEDERFARQALLEREAEMARFIQHAPVAVAMFDREMHYLQFSQRWLEDYQLADRSPTGRSYYEVTPGIPAHWKTVHRRGLAGEVLRSEEEAFMRTDGSVQWLRWEVRPWYAAGSTVGGLLIFSEDITIRVEIAAALRESEARFLSFMNQSPILAWIKDDQDRFRFANLAFEKHFAREGVQLLGHTDHVIYPSEIAERVQADDRQVRDSAKTLETSEHVPGADGRMRHWLVHKFLLPRPGQPAWIGGTAVDVTARRVAEDELFAKSALLESIVESSLHGMLVVGPDGKKLFQNRRAIELWEVPPAIAANPDASVQLSHAMAMTKDPDAFVSKVTDLYAHPASASHDIVELKNGTILDRYSASVVGADGTHHGRIWLFYDITERKTAERELRASEERLLALLASSDAMIWEADAATFAVTAVSANVERILGYPAADWLQPDFWTSHLDPEDRTQAVAYCKERTGQGANYELDYRFRAADGHVVWLHHVVKVITEEGKPRWLRGLMVNITHTRSLEEQVRQSQKLQAVGTLAGGIAHDFNNILTGIYGYTELARETATGNPELQNYLREIGRAARRAAQLVQQILTFSREPAGAEHLIPLALELIVFEATQLLRATTPATIEFQPQLAEGLPRVLGNASQLHQIVMNLGTNAIHAMRHRLDARLTIRIEACVVDAAFAQTLPHLAPGPYVRLAVGDTGTGMDAATQARIFEPFFTTKAQGEGTGLGLSVVYGIVRHHHGAIRVTSEIGRGTTFEIYLPASAGTSEETSPEPPAIPRGHHERIFLIDDEPVVIRTGQLALTHLGYAAVGETNVRLALARLQRDPQAFDLVISDQTMPGMTGLELAELIRALRPDLPVIITSGHSETLTAESIQAAGVREVLAKPYLLSDLSAAIRRHLRPKP